jgi:Cu+-exporting ATPase
MAILPTTDHITTTLFINNFHCISCLHYIQELLSTFHPDPPSITADYSSKEIVVIHSSQQSPHEILQILLDAAFDIQSLQSKDEFGHVIYEQYATEIPQKWSEKSNQAHGKETYTSIGHDALVSPNSPNDGNKKDNLKHLEHCVACQKQEVKLAVAEDVAPAIPKAQKFTATLSIAGMTCAACILAINEGVQEISSLESISVSLLTNSATVVFAGPKSNIDEIVETIEDRGFGCEVEAIAEAGALQKEGGNAKRIVMIKIAGMSSPRCPLLVLEHLSSAFPELLGIEEQATLENPIMVLAYYPRRGLITIRDILETVSSINNHFKFTIYHPPTIEERSRAMQIRERHRLLLRLVLSFVVAIPTFLIGVVWMSLVSPTNDIRRFFEERMWAGVNTRTEWALFFLATPVMFFAADVFHIRAMKELHALWSSKSRVPILRRFYRFGSMNLLMSAGSKYIFRCCL